MNVQEAPLREFGVSPCRLELLTVEAERAGRNVIGGQVDSEQEEEEIVRKVNKETVLALALACCTLWIVLAVGITVVWSTAESRVFGLAILPTAIVAGLLVV